MDVNQEPDVWDAIMLLMELEDGWHEPDSTAPNKAQAAAALHAYYLMAEYVEDIEIPFVTCNSDGTISLGWCGDSRRFEVACLKRGVYEVTCTDLTKDPTDYPYATGTTINISALANTYLWFSGVNPNCPFNFDNE